MQRGFPEYGCHIQTEKSFTNFSDDSSSREFVLFGNRIDCSTFTCRPDFTPYFDRNIVYATTIKCTNAFDAESVTK